MILKRLAVGPYQSNCYILGSEDTLEAIIIDPGAEAEKITEAVRELGLKIKLILVTHGHMDHLGALDQVREATGAPAFIHASDAAGRLEEEGFLKYVSAGDTIQLGELQFTVLHTPGHSPGGISLYGEGLLFSGDTLFNYGIGRYDLQGASFAQLSESLNKLLSLPDETVLLPGHGPDSTIGTEKRGNPFLHA